MITRFEKRVVGLQFPVFFFPFHKSQMEQQKKVERRSNNDGC